VLIAIISDTHMPKRGRTLPARCSRLLAGAELILHAGDFSTVGVFEQLAQIGPPVKGVAGNVDEPALRARLPQVLELELEGVAVAMLHDAGPARGRLARMRRRFPDAAAVLFGHSHLPLLESAPDGFQIFNPGSPTERRLAPAHSMGLACVRAGAIRFKHVGV
jgi:putative phosphoesterase